MDVRMNEMSVLKSDIILIGAGVMSATLGTIVKELAPEMKITVFEKLRAQVKKARMNGITRALVMQRFVN